ncbi:hypothetical protein J6590_065381 [Homalodisca vitripennis]|nr:hypothetical protein J6590_065381 [Homalodisca vitripennis]
MAPSWSEDQNEILGVDPLELFKREFKPIFKKGKRGGTILLFRSPLLSTRLWLSSSED